MLIKVYKYLAYSYLIYIRGKEARVTSYRSKEVSLIY